MTPPRLPPTLTSGPRRPAGARRSPFVHARLRLAAWNLAVLCAILLVVATGVYVSQSRVLVAEVDAQLAGQAQRDLAGGQALEELAEAAAPPAVPAARPATEEDGEPYEARESPNLFSLLLDAHGRVARRPADLRVPALPDLAAAVPVLRGSQRATLVTIEASSPGGRDDFRLYTVPVLQGGRVVGALQVGTSLTPREAELRAFLGLLALTGGLGLALAAIGSFFLADRALVPLRQAFERQRAFVADASHELRTPLSLMRAEAELLRRALARAAARPDGALVAAGPHPAATARPSPPAPDDETLEMAGDLVTEVDYMSHLVDALLQLARMDGGAEPWRREPIALGELVARTCRVAEPLAAERGLRLTAGAAGGGDEGRGPRDDHAALAGDGTPPVWGDPDRLRQLLLILLDNALRYTPAGGAVAVAWWAEPGAVVLEVADTGPGIAPEHLPRLFDRFYRVDKARSREQGGSGLGLAIAEAIARAHGGDLSVRSAPGAGTMFRLTLPARP